MKRLYLGRKNNRVYELGTAKKYWSPYYGFSCGHLAHWFDNTLDFTRIFGVRLAPGEIRRVSINIELLD